MKLKVLQHRMDHLDIMERELDVQQAFRPAGTMERTEHEKRMRSWSTTRTASTME